MNAIYPSLEQLVSHKTKYRLQWFEPAAATDAQGQELTADILSSASVAHCIDMARAAHRHAGGRPEDETDVGLLGDFIAVNWASVVGCLPSPQHVKDHWVIPHPGTLAPMICTSFQSTMEQYYEGFNIPVRVIAGVREPFWSSCERVAEYEKTQLEKTRTVEAQDRGGSAQGT